MESANMSNFRLMTKSQQFLFWPNNASKVELSWKEITFELNELIGVIGIRYNGGTYCYVFPNNSLTGNWPHGECENDVFNIKTLNTIHHGRCYTIEFPQSVRFFAADNVIVYMKRSINLFIHGQNQGIGLLANYFPVPHIVHPLQAKQIHKLDFQYGEVWNDEILGCNTNVDERDYYECAKDMIGKNLRDEKSPGCTVPMFSNVFRDEMPPMCSDQFLAIKAVKHGRTELRQLIQNDIKECEKACKIRNYVFSPLISNDIADKDPDSYFYIALITNQTIVKEHLRVFDANSIIGTIGGALGLFVGFSFLSCIKDICDWYSRSYGLTQFNTRRQEKDNHKGDRQMSEKTKTLETFDIDL